MEAFGWDQLNAAGEKIVRQLGGQWANGSGMCHCPAHADRSPSLSVRIGARALLFKCFAGCTNAEIFHALRRERLDVRSLPVGQSTRVALSTRTDGAARRLWRAASPLAGTPAERYLRARKIPTFPLALRYHGATPLGRQASVRFVPALLAAISDGHEILGVQRIFLQANGRPAPMLKHKRTLGAPRCGAVMLSPVTSVLGLAEGVESALSASILFDIPVWATLGAERLGHIIIPDSITRLILLADNDIAGRRAVSRARRRYTRPGLEIDVRWPPPPFNDWNDLLRAGEKVVAEWARLAA